MSQRPAQDFYITLLSNDSKQKYSENTLSHFTNYLDPPLSLQAQHWKVGISEIFYNSYVPSYFNKHHHEYNENVTENEAHSKVYADCVQVIQTDGSAREKCFKLGGPPLMDFFFIYCDIIHLRSAGSQCAKILKVLPAPSHPEQVLRFGHIEYVPIHDDFIRSISIRITNQQGEQIQFVESVLPTMVTLHFKKISI